MKSYIKNFSSFLNEDADGDYFQVNSPKHSGREIYGLHRRGSSDWHNTGTPDWNKITSDEPSDELSPDEFIKKYGDDLDTDGRDYIERESTPETRIKTWKSRSQVSKDPALNLIQSASTDDLHHMRTQVEKGLNKASEKGASSALVNKLTSILDKISLEINSRNK